MKVRQEKYITITNLLFSYFIIINLHFSYFIPYNFKLIGFSLIVQFLPNINLFRLSYFIIA